MKRILSMLLVCAMLVMAAALAGCNTTESQQSNTGKVFTVGICQLVQHEALDAATKGFKDALSEALGEGNVVFDEQNASGEATNCTTIVNGFVAKNVDLIMANATPSLQAAAAGTDTIPVLGTSITEYGVALELTDFNGVVGTNVSGTSDLAPLDQQAAMFKEWFPEAKNIGLLYCSAEPNSKYQVDTVQAELEKQGYTVTQYSFTDTNDVTTVTQNACEHSDALYIPTDNTAASNTEAIANVTMPAKVPVIAGEVGILKGCGVASLSISYYDLGVATGKMAAKILKGEANVAEMPIEYAANFTKLYNAANCEALGLTVPDGYTAVEE